MRAPRELNERVASLITENGMLPYITQPIRKHNDWEAVGSKKWTVLSPSVVSHPGLGNWILKMNYADGTNKKYISSGVKQLKPGNFDNLQRPIFGNILRKGARAVGLDLRIPREYVIDLGEQAAKEKQDFRDRYCVISEKFTIPPDQLASWEELAEEGLLEETIRRICLFIIKTGYADATVSNIVLTEDRGLAVVDTENLGLLRDDEEKEKADYNLSNYVIAGLDRFANEFASTLENQYVKNNKISISTPDELAFTPEPLKVRQRIKQLATIVETQVKVQKEEYLKMTPLTIDQSSAHTSKRYHWILIVSSIFLPLIPFALLIAATVKNLFPPRPLLLTS
jgi:hypothetical protein